LEKRVPSIGKWLWGEGFLPEGEEEVFGFFLGFEQFRALGFDGGASFCKFVL